MDSNTAIVALTGISAVSDFSLKAYSLGTNDAGMAIGSIGYVSIAVILSKILGQEGVAYVNNMWNVGTSALETAIAYYQGEKLTNKNLLGCVLIIIGAYLVRDGRRK